MGLEGPTFNEEKVNKAVDRIDEKSDIESTGEAFSEKELEEIKILLDGLSKDGLDKVKNIIEKAITESASEELKSLLTSIETEKNTLLKNKGFESLKDGFSGNEIMSKFIGDFDEYLDKELNFDLKSNEKDTVKLVLLDKFQSLIFDKGELIPEIKNILKDLLNDKADVFSLLGDIKEGKLGNIQTIITKNITDIKKYKNENSDKDLSDSSLIKGILSGQTENIEPLTDELKIDYLTKLKGDTKVLGEEVKNILSEGKFEMSEKFKKGLGELLKTLKDKFPILGGILSLFLGIDSGIEEGVDKKKKSIDNLLKYSKKNKSPLNGLDKTFFKDFDTTKLKDFYTFLEKKGVTEDQYSKDTFWNDLMIGGSDSERLNEIYKSLKGNDVSIFGEGKIKGDDFIKKLNGLKDKEKEKKTNS